jgi:protein O-mannosyl-transferase
LFLLAFATKETSISLPVALLFFQGATRKGRLSPRTARGLHGHLIYWLMALAFGFVAITHPGYKRLLMQSISFTNLYESVLTQAHGVWYLLSHAVVPTSLNIAPDLAVVRSVSLQVAGKSLSIIGALILGLIALRRHPCHGFAIPWFLFHTFLVYAIAARSDVINERHLYLGSWGLCLLFALAMARMLHSWPRIKKLVWVGAYCLVLLLMGLTIVRNKAYTSEVLLWQDTARKSPAKAGEAYTRALELNPTSIITRNNLAVLDGGSAPPRISD